ncbi:MAG TPA: hypothetical protein VEU33_50960 [Archangium sp.]|nr:hypothetical protein [Archangium sp.]
MVIGELSATLDKASYDIAEEVEQLAHYAQRLESRKYDSVIRKELKVTAGSAADLPTTNPVGTGVIVQCIKEGSKLRARVVSDGYDPNLNIRFPRDIREENVLYVVEEITTTANGSSYIACGDIHRLVQ